MLHHIPEKSMGKLDALSWRADHRTGSKDNYNIVLLHPKLFVICTVEGLEFEGPEKDILRDIHKRSKQLEEEPVERQCMRFKGCPCALFIWQNGQSAMAFFIIAVTSIILQPLIFNNTLSCFAITLRSLGILDVLRPSSSSSKVISGWTCHTISAWKSSWSSLVIFLFWF